ncbi:MAG: sigma-70 family RNA polymerase sigma factor [Chitinophagales bacterium]
MQSKSHSDHQFIQALLENNREGIKAVYQYFMKECIGFVQKNNGTVEDALDIFQESLKAITLYIRKRPEFILTVPFGGFLYPFYRSLWFKELKRRQQESVIKSELKAYKDNNQDSFNPTIEEEINQDQKRLNKLLQQLKGLSEICQKILQLTYWKNQKPREIAPILGISANYVAAHKVRCLKNLKKQML